MDVEIYTRVEGIAFDRIQNFVHGNSNGNFYQDANAFEFFSSVPNFSPFLIVASENEVIKGTLVGTIIKENGWVKDFFSKRCIVEGGPLAEGGNPEVINKILEKLDNYVSGKAIYTEIRNFNDTSDNDKIFGLNGYNFEEHLNFIVTIEDYETARQNLSRSRKREINKSLKTGAEIIEPENIEQVKKFYAILSDLYAEIVKKPLPQFSFFREFFERKDLGKYFLVKYEEDVIGGIMCPIFKDTIYEWYVCGLDREFNNIYPSVLATWAPIEYAANNGLKYFDFMGAGKPDEDYGVREFKSRFGGELVNYGRYTRINNPLLYKIGELGIKILY